MLKNMRKLAFHMSFTLLPAALLLPLLLAPVSLWGKDPEDPRTRIDVKSYVVDVTLHPDEHSLEAKVKIRFVAQVDDLSQLIFNFNANLVPTQILDEKNRPLRFSQDQDAFKLQVDLTTPLQRQQEGALTFDYHGVLDKPDRSPVEDVMLAKISETGSYLLARSYWLPMNGYNFDRASIQLNATVPSGLQVVSQGKLVSVDKTPKGDVYHWQTDDQNFPLTLTAGKYVQATIPTESIPVTLYLNESEARLAKEYGEMAGKIINFYISKFSLFPFASYTLVEIDDTTVGGYSAPGLALVAKRTLTAKVNYRLLAHEIAHQWWGLRLSPRYKGDDWLSEGFATYSAALFMEDYAGEGAYEDEMLDIGIRALVHEGAA